MHQLTRRPPRLAVAVAVLALALAAALTALPRDQAAATPPSGVTAELLARGTIGHAGHVRVAGIKPQTRGPVDVATVKSGQLTLHRAKGCRSRTFGPGQTFLEFGPDDVNLTRNQTATVTETVVTFLLPVGAPITVDSPAPACRL
jgi:hypothetical protein